MVLRIGNCAHRGSVCGSRGSIDRSSFSTPDPISQPIPNIAHVLNVRRIKLNSMVEPWSGVADDQPGGRPPFYCELTMTAARQINYKLAGDVSFAIRFGHLVFLRLAPIGSPFQFQSLLFHSGTHAQTHTHTHLLHPASIPIRMVWIPHTRAVEFTKSNRDAFRIYVLSFIRNTFHPYGWIVVVAKWNDSGDENIGRTSRRPTWKHWTLFCGRARFYHFSLSHSYRFRFDVSFFFFLKKRKKRALANDNFNDTPEQ